MLQPGDIAEYTGERKDTGPVTLTTSRSSPGARAGMAIFPHLTLFSARGWGLIVYDEVHLLPAPIFRATADLQAHRAGRRRIIQVSGAFGSRQEEAQCLGRILRPKQDGRAAHFFTLVSRDTREEEFAHHRKLFLTEQGCSYQVVVAGEK